MEEIRHIPLERGITKVALMRGDEELSSTLVIPMTMRVGVACLRMDGIGSVATPEQHRNRGYSRQVLEAAVSFMTASDAVLSTLYGIPNFYPKYGFATLGPEPIITLRSLEERLSLPVGLDIRPGEPDDLPALQRLYRDETTTAIGALVRDDDWWTWEVLEKALQPGEDEVRVVMRDQCIVGYAWRAAKCWWMEFWTRREPDGLKLGEAFAADAEAADALIAACRRWAAESGEHSVAMAFPETIQVGAAARLQNVDVLERYGDEAEFMGRSTGLLELLRELQPELLARWRCVSGSLPSFALTIVTGSERATIIGNERGIQIEPGRVGNIEVTIDPGNVARLALGGFDPDRVLERVHAPQSAVPILATLFPQRSPYIYPVDRF